MLKFSNYISNVLGTLKDINEALYNYFSKLFFSSVIMEYGHILLLFYLRVTVYFNFIFHYYDHYYS